MSRNQIRKSQHRLWEKLAQHSHLHKSRDGPLIYHTRDGPENGITDKVLIRAGPPEGTGPPLKEEYG